MANIKLVKHIKTTRKIPKTFEDYINYLILVLPLGFIGLGLSMTNNYFKFHTGSEILFISIILVLMGLFGFYISTKRLIENGSFESIENTKKYSIETIADKLKEKFKLNDIKVDLNSDLIVAFTKTSAFSWGEKLTILIDNNSVLVNSRPAGARQPITILKDKLNINKIRKLLE